MPSDPSPADHLAALRRDYQLGGLDEADAPGDPIELFRRWFEEAGGLYEPNAMLLATADDRGRPSARTVLLKGLDRRGFVFFTNEDSRKGRELAANPWCALTFPWFELQRQVRVEGEAFRLPREESEQYFASRPRGSQLGAWASEQSAPVAGRETLDRTYDEAVTRFGEGEVPCPPFWGGFVVRPVMIEFWQGRSGRMHDRLRYRQVDDAWTLDRLAP